MSILLGPVGRQRVEGVRLARLPGTLTMAAGIVSIVSVLLLIQTSGVASVGYDIQRLEEVRDHWRDSNWQLEHEIASLKSLDRIEREARSRLKMTPATKPLYVSVNVQSSGPRLTAWSPTVSPAPPVRVRPASGLQGFLAWLAAQGQGEVAS